MDILPEWFEKTFAERMKLAMGYVATARTTEELWSAQGRVKGLIDLESEIDLVRAQAADEEKKAAERFLKTDA